MGVLLALGALITGVLTFFHHGLDATSVVATLSGAILAAALLRARSAPAGARKAATAGAIGAGVCLWWTGVAPVLAISYVALSGRRPPDSPHREVP
ncbi:MAG: hypothetical protein ACRDUY_13535 [Nitriliruptorales bacterium]